MDTAWFQINLSMKCNLDCFYCYVPDKGSDLAMSDRSILNIARFGGFIAKEYGIKKIKATFLGGEPTLFLNRVERTALLFKKLISSELILWLFTNGTLLTDEMMKRLSELGIFVVVSANHTDEEVILKACEVVSKYQPVVRVSIVEDVFNLKRLEKLSFNIMSKGWHVRYFLENEAFKDREFMEMYEPTILSCLDIVNDLVKDPKRMVYLYQNMHPGVQDEISHYLVGKSICVFDPDGTVRPATCMRTKAILGNLNQPSDYFFAMKNYTNREKELPRWSAQYIRECDGCIVRSVCQGGYPPPRWYAHGRFDKPTPYCELFKRIIPKYVDIYKNKSEVEK